MKFKFNAPGPVRRLLLFRSRVDNMDYARLALVNDPTAIKSIAVSTLLNPHQFSHVC